jgi:hypothetical protein
VEGNDASNAVREKKNVNANSQCDKYFVSYAGSKVGFKNVNSNGF